VITVENDCGEAPGESSRSTYHRLPVNV